MKNNSYRILKLKSGEELITKIIHSNKDKLTIEKPMIFKSTMVTDPYGRAKEITVLKNWLLFADHEEASIPKDFVATYLKPDMDVLELYRLEKKKDEELKKKNRIIKRPNKDTKGKNTNAESEFDSIMNILNKFKNKDDIIDKIMNNIDDMSDEEFKAMQESYQEQEQEQEDEDFTNYITMNIVLPPEALLSLVDSGLIDEEEILRMISALKSQAEMNNNIMDHYGRDKDYKNFGKNWKDWSPYPEDYLHDDDLD
tara:strand:+ start:32 stop:796 length:765 start_codon:yes stop_codon:yes gene_type:complete